MVAGQPRFALYYATEHAVRDSNRLGCGVVLGFARLAVHCQFSSYSCGMLIFALDNGH